MFSDMMTYYRLALYVKTKFKEMHFKLKNFKKTIRLMWDKYFKVAIRQVVDVRDADIEVIRQMPGYTFRKYEGETLDRFNVPKVREVIIDEYVSEKIKNYRDNCTLFYGSNKK